MASRQQAEQVIQIVTQYLFTVAAGNAPEEQYDTTVTQVLDVLNEAE
jgi:hypothetical protein